MFHRSDVLQIGNVSLWRSEVVVVAGTLFHTSQETLTCIPGSRLAALMSQPYPLLDPDRDVHVIPAAMCRTADAFAAILEYLRGPPQWPYIRSEREWRDIVDACAALGIDTTPPRPYPSALLRPRYDYAHVLIPRVATWREKVKGRVEVLPQEPQTHLNSCAMLSSLSDKGFVVRKEVHLQCSNAARAALVGSKDAILQAAIGDAAYNVLNETEREGFRAKLQSTCTAVVLERRRPHLPLSDALSTMSSWVGALIDNEAR